MDKNTKIVLTTMILVFISSTLFAYNINTINFENEENYFYGIEVDLIKNNFNQYKLENINVINEEEIILIVAEAINEYEKKQNDLHKEKIYNIYDFLDMDVDHIYYLVNKAYEYEIDPDLVLALIWTESGFNYNAKNPKSTARGYGQFIKSTGKFVFEQIYGSDKKYIHKKHCHDPYINIDMTVHYIKRCLNGGNNNLYSAIKIYRGMEDKPYYDKIIHRRNYIKRNKQVRKEEFLASI